MGRSVVLAAGLAVVSIACGSGGGETTTPTAAPTSASATSAASADPTAIEGTWRTAEVSEADIEATLRDEGLERWIEPLRALPEADPPGVSNVFILEVRDGRWDLAWEKDGAAAVEIDYDAKYEVDADTVTVTHEDDLNIYRWSVDGDMLTFEWLETTYADYGGIPEQVFQTAFFMTATFERQPE